MCEWRTSAMALVLHSHMPYVEGFGTWPFGEEWLWEAVATVYLPLLDLLEGSAAPVTVGVTPVLCDQLETLPGEPGERLLAFLSQTRRAVHEEDSRGLDVTGQPELAAEVRRAAHLRGQLGLSGVFEAPRVLLVHGAARLGQKRQQALARFARKRLELVAEHGGDAHGDRRRAAFEQVQQGQVDGGHRLPQPLLAERPGAEALHVGHVRVEDERHGARPPLAHALRGGLRHLAVRRGVAVGGGGHRLPALAGPARRQRGAGHRGRHPRALRPARDASGRTGRAPAGVFVPNAPRRARGGLEGPR